MSRGRPAALSAGCVTTTADIADHLQLARTSRQLIAIDGVPGAGKTHLATCLRTSLDVESHLDFDDFLIPDQGQYFSALRLQDLRDAMAQKLPSIVSGVCMRKVLETLGVSNAFHIYVKRVDQRGGWPDEFETVAGAIERVALEMGMAAEDWALEREIRDYPLQYEPHQRADLIYERSEDDGLT